MAGRPTVRKSIYGLLRSEAKLDRLIVGVCALIADQSPELICLSPLSSIKLFPPFSSSHRHQLTLVAAPNKFTSGFSSCDRQGQ
jgi:hypothetical protein